MRAYRRDTGALLGAAISSAGGVGDASYASTSLILRGNGADASTAITDESVSPKTVSVFGNAQIDTAQSQFGGSSILFDGTGDYLSVADSTDWDIPGNATVEFWFRTEVASGPSFTIGIIGTGTFGSTAGWAVGHYLGNLSVRVNSTLYSGSGTISTGAWYHVALVWNGASFKCYLNGAELYSGTAAAIDTSSALIVGNVSPVDASRYFQGYVDDIRITKGVARYTADFSASLPTEIIPSLTVLAVGGYSINLAGYAGELQVVCLDDAGGTTENDLIIRTTGV